MYQECVRVEGHRQEGAISVLKLNYFSNTECDRQKITHNKADNK